MSSKLFMLALTVLSCTQVSMAQDNPFKGVTFYVNPTFQENIDKAIKNLKPGDADADKITKNLKTARDVPSAYWLDVMKKVQPDGTGTDTMNGILEDAAKKSPAPMPIFIIYDLPNRDCSAFASNGEVCCKQNADKTCDYKAAGDCKEGLDIYRTKYIDNIITIANKFKDKVPMAFIVEPDSLGNLVSNSDNPNCGAATKASYTEGIKYAVAELKKNLPKAPVYLDLAHGGWLGYEKNAAGTGTLIKSMGILDSIRGFATNVANYQPLGTACSTAKSGFCLDKANSGNPCCTDPCKLIKDNNPGNTEVNYVQQMSEIFPGKFFIVDTGRNGVPDMRTSCSNWCNIRGAGLGTLPTINTPSPLIDALLWLKTPGETDGCTQETPSGPCKRFDKMCASADSMGSKSGEPRVPEAGTFMDFQMYSLAKNANFGSGGGSSGNSTGAAGPASTEG